MLRAVLLIASFAASVGQSQEDLFLPGDVEAALLNMTKLGLQVLLIADMRPCADCLSKVA